MIPDTLDERIKLEPRDHMENWTQDLPENPILGTLKERTEREPKDHLAPTSRGWGGLLCLRALHYDCTVEFIRESEPHGSEWDEL